MQRKKYVNNADLKIEIASFQKTAIISEKLHLMLHEMAKKIASKSCWSGYTWKDDMISTAYVKCLNILHKIDINRGNIFSYLTTVINNTFIDYIKFEKRQDRIKGKIKDNIKTELYLEHGIDFQEYSRRKKK